MTLDVPVHREILQTLADLIRKALPGFGFVLVLFDFGAKGSMHFVSNGHRPDVIRMLRELLEKIESEQN